MDNQLPSAEEIVARCPAVATRLQSQLDQSTRADLRRLLFFMGHAAQENDFIFAATQELRAGLEPPDASESLKSIPEFADRLCAQLDDSTRGEFRIIVFFIAFAAEDDESVRGVAGELYDRLQP